MLLIYMNENEIVNNNVPVHYKLYAKERNCFVIIFGLNHKIQDSRMKLNFCQQFITNKLTCLLLQLRCD